MTPKEYTDKAIEEVKENLDLLTAKVRIDIPANDKETFTLIDKCINSLEMIKGLPDEKV
jgi:hypothetical protein